jgi:hypothetical protein
MTHVGGDKSTASRFILKQCLDAGVLLAAINFRFRTEAPINVVLRDSAGNQSQIEFLLRHLGVSAPPDNGAFNHRP